MWRKRPRAFAGLVLLALGATFGFASFATNGAEPSSERPDTAVVPAIVSGRLTAAIFSSLLSPDKAENETPPSPEDDVDEPETGEAATDYDAIVTDAAAATPPLGWRDTGTAARSSVPAARGS